MKLITLDIFVLALGALPVGLIMVSYGSYRLLKKLRGNIEIGAHAWVSFGQVKTETDLNHESSAPSNPLDTNESTPKLVSGLRPRKRMSG